MALLRDGQINSLEDLGRYESGLLAVTSIERIDLNEKMALAQDIIAGELLVFLLNQSGREPQNYLTASRSGSARRALGTSDVVVTAPLKRWHALRTIELTYEDAFNNQLNDRYRGKWQQYRERAVSASDQLYGIGVGLVAEPIGGAGSPLLLAGAGTSLGAQYYVRMSWINRSAQEGAPSDVVGLETVDGNNLIVAAGDNADKAVGWNVYVGHSPESVSLQNQTPLDPQRDWICPAIGLRLGRPAGTGQAPDRYVVDDRAYRRG